MQATTTSLLTLPPELILQIFSVLRQRNDKRSLNALSLCSRTIHQIVEPLLYQDFFVNLNSSTASNSYSALFRRTATYVTSTVISISWEHYRRGSFEDTPFELLCRLRRLKIKFSSDFPTGRLYFSRIWNMLKRLNPGTLRSITLVFNCLPSSDSLAELNSSLHRQNELEEFSLLREWSFLRDQQDPALLDYSHFPKLRLFEGQLELRPRNAHPTCFFWPNGTRLQKVVDSFTRNPGSIIQLHIRNINSNSVADFRRLSYHHPEIEVLGVLQLDRDNRGRIFGDSLWEILNKFPKLRAFSVFLNQTPALANKTTRDMLLKAPPNVHKIRLCNFRDADFRGAALELFELKEFTRDPTSSLFTISLDEIFNYQSGGYGAYYRSVERYFCSFMDKDNFFCDY